MKERENRTMVEARCPWDGTVPVRIVEMSCATAAGDGANGPAGLCSFACPTCGREVINPVPLDGIKTLWLLGSEQSTGHVPFELLEPHTGPPLSWDDVLDAHEALERICCPPSSSRPPDGKSTKDAQEEAVPLVPKPERP